MVSTSGQTVLSSTRFSGNGPWGLSVITTCGKGGDKGAEEQVPWQLTTALSQGKSWLTRACTLCPGMVPEGLRVAYRHTHSPLQSNSPVRPQRTEATQRTKQAGEESWLK